MKTLTTPKTRESDMRNLLDRLKYGETVHAHYGYAGRYIDGTYFAVRRKCAAHTGITPEEAIESITTKRI